MSRSRFVIAFLIVALALTLQMRFLDPAGSSLPLSLSVILGLSLLMNMGSIALLSLFSFFMVNWRPGITPEFLAFIMIPLVASFLSALFPLRSALNAGVVGVIGMALWYVTANPAGTFAAFPTVLFEAILSGFVAAFVFGFFQWVLESPRITRL